MIVDVYEGDADEVIPVTRDELGNLALGSELCGMRGDCNDLATVRVATCHNVTAPFWRDVLFTCSGCRASIQLFDDQNEPIVEGGDLRFCPNCGRKVVRDD